MTARRSRNTGETLAAAIKKAKENSQTQRGMSDVTGRVNFPEIIGTGEQSPFEFQYAFSQSPPINFD
jgi:SAM-dependent MidA family methyltransferase